MNMMRKCAISMVKPTNGPYTHFLTRFEVGHTHFGLSGLASLLDRQLLMKLLAAWEIHMQDCSKDSWLKMFQISHMPVPC